MSIKVFIYLMIFDIISTIDSNEDYKIDKIPSHCSSLDQKNNDPKCLKYEDLTHFKELMQTIGLRLMSGHKVAVAKWDTNGTIVDPVREEQVIENVVSQSKDINLDEVWVKQFFRDQIDANVYIQQKLHEIWLKSGHRPEGPAVDLTTEIRPLIDRLNKELILFSNQTKHLRKSDSCPHVRDMCSEETAKNISMNTFDTYAYGMALTHICLPVPIHEHSLHSSKGYAFKSFGAYFTAIIVCYFGLFFK